ncbi:hypothetical protein, conserved [Eimeria praecox]|uniref:CRAL-TRIO domain-containing protein n=1 Tax=Eimeria praecox TaxID=51316 RepID=U6H754_9EIME|nr:hypothetical protein, conserved [Eimeria praecox]
MQVSVRRGRCGELVHPLRPKRHIRLYRFYILHAPRLFHFIAKPLVSSLPTTTAKKLRVFTNADEWDQERRAQFAAHQLEKKYGGTAPDITQERRAQFAAHQLEKKYGGTAPDITEHWYPFRFFPGPFEPEGEAGQRGDRNAAVRWESEQALHAKVHPLVHTGASLHTSLIWSRRAERRSPPLRYAAWLRHLPDLHLAPATVDWAPLRYAAWLRHLPDLHLAPATVDWAGGILRSRLQGHHDFLAQRLTDRQSETTADILNLHVGNGSAEGIPQSSFVHEAKPEKENKEADSQRISELPALSDPVGETRQIPSTCSAHFPPQQNSSIDNVASASPVCSSPASLRRIPTTPCCGAADFTGKGLTAVDTLPSLPNPVEREAFEETKSPAELYVLCSSGARTSVEQVHPPLPHAVTTGRSATAAAEGPGDDCSSSVVAAEKYSNAWQSQSVPFSRTAPDATSGEACSVVVPETQTQFRYDDARSERLDLLEGFSQSTISKQMCGPPAPEVQPRQCSPLSIASCNEREDDAVALVIGGRKKIAQGGTTKSHGASRASRAAVWQEPADTIEGAEPDSAGVNAFFQKKQATEGALRCLAILRLTAFLK